MYKRGVRCDGAGQRCALFYWLYWVFFLTILVPFLAGPSQLSSFISPVSVQAFSSYSISGVFYIVNFTGCVLAGQSMGIPTKQLAKGNFVC